MPSVEIRKVTNKKELDTFIQFHYDLYRGNEYDAPNLYRDELHTLSKNKNSAFEFCEAEYFLAYKDGKVVGTPIIIILPSYWLFHQPITWRAVVGAAISVLGVSLFFLH